MNNDYENNLVRRLSLKDAEAPFDALDYLDEQIEHRNGVSQAFADGVAGLPTLLLDSYFGVRTSNIEYLISKTVGDNSSLVTRVDAFRVLVHALAADPASYYHNKGLLATWDDVTLDNGSSHYWPFEEPEAYRPEPENVQDEQPPKQPEYPASPTNKERMHPPPIPPSARRQENALFT